jgi:hypothetical protein
MKISLFASAIRTKDWPAFMNSLDGNECEYEVVFCGPDNGGYTHPKLKFIQSTVKPAQCYEIALRACTGDLVHWTADDAVYSPKCLDEIIKFWEKINNPKAIISVQTKESGHFNVMRTHRFFAGFNPSPIMAPLGVMSRTYLKELGNISSKYICGQYENDIVLRVMQDGGTVELFLDDHYVDLDHKNKHDPSVNKFFEGYAADRVTLEKSWYGDWNKHDWPEGPLVRYDTHVPFSATNLKTVSQEPKGIWA